jgi:hypothetical protein
LPYIKFVGLFWNLVPIQLNSHVQRS